MYQFLFQETFEAYDSLADVLALSRICLQPIHSDVLTKQVKSEAKPKSYLLEKSDFDVHRVQNTNDSLRLLKQDKPSLETITSEFRHFTCSFTVNVE